MRLTLRTLLAYIDNILEPEDQEELAKRIAASDVASDLLHRIRDASRRLRLTAPPLEATGKLSDPNAVAEYLDNTLPPDDVTEFERRCLDLETFPDADSHLAEAATCHHVLTMVLAERAEIDPDSKKRMYALPQRSQAHAPVTAAVGAPVAAAAPAVGPGDSSLHEVPDYLRASDRPLLGRLLPAIAALLLLGVTLLFAFGENGWLTSDPPAIAEGDPAEPAQQPDQPVLPPPTVDPPATGGAPAEPAPVLPDEPSATSESGEPAAPPINVPAPVVPPLPAEPESPSESTEPVVPMADEPTAPPIEPLVPQEPTPPPVDEPMTGAASDEPTAEGGGDEGLVNPAEPEEPTEPQRLGLAAGKGQVLLRYSEADNVWLRVEARAEIMPGDRLLSLPTYQPSVLFENRVAMDLFDGTRVDVANIGESTPSVAITYGRMLLTNFGQQPAELSLTIGEQPGQLVLQPSASLAVSVRRLFQPGIDPRQASAPLEALCYAPLGDVSWQGPGFDIQVEERGMWSLTDVMTSRVAAYDEDPDWVTGRELTRVEREASPSIEKQLTPGEPIWAQLSVVAESSRKDERALATIFAVHVGQFDSTVQALRDEEQQLSWSDEIEALRFAMSSSPALARAVYEELNRQHRQELADELYEMLCGYNLDQVGRTPDEWRVGAMRKLIEWLASDQLDYRVLANYNLEKITGRRGVFNPIGPSGAREQSINRQRARLEDGDLKPSGLMDGAG